MWDKLNRFQIINLIAFVIVLTCAFIAVTTKDPTVQAKFMDMGLVGVIGWAFTRNKNT